jgi:hypothetical protein
MPHRATSESIAATVNGASGGAELAAVSVAGIAALVSASSSDPEDSPQAKRAAVITATANVVILTSNTFIRSLFAGERVVSSHESVVFADGEVTGYP